MPTTSVGKDAAIRACLRQLTSLKPTDRIAAIELGVTLIKKIEILQTEKAVLIHGLLARMGDGDQHVKKYACKAIFSMWTAPTIVVSRTQEITGIQGILSLMKDEDYEIRGCAIKAIIILFINADKVPQDQQAVVIQNLLDLANDNDENIRKSVRSAILHTVHVKVPEEQIEEVMEGQWSALINDKAYIESSNKIAVNLIKIIEKLHTKTAVTMNYFLTFANDDDEGLSWNAILALCMVSIVAIPQRQAWQIIQGLLGWLKDQNNKTRACASAAVAALLVRNDNLPQDPESPAPQDQGAELLQDLLGLVTDRHETVRNNISLAILHMVKIIEITEEQIKAVIATLLFWLMDSNSCTRMHASAALAVLVKDNKIPESQKAAVLRGLLGVVTDEHAMVRCNLSLAIGSMVYKRSVPQAQLKGVVRALLAGLKDSDSNIKMNATDALTALVIEGKIRKDQENTVFQNLLKLVNDTHVGVYIRSAILHMMPECHMLAREALEVHRQHISLESLAEIRACWQSSQLGLASEEIISNVNGFRACK